MKDTITLAELRKTELYRREQTRFLREFLGEYMKQEPYCWRMKANDPDDKDWWLFGRKPTRDEKVSHSAIPLYTAPKHLSDEEIKAIDNSVKYSELALSHDEYMNKFARAILKKASEK